MTQPSKAEYFVGVDLGQARDYTGVVVLEREDVPTVGEPRYYGGHRVHAEPRTVAHYALRRMERLKLGTTYPAVVEHVRALMAREPLRGATLIVDATGVGRPVVDLIRASGLSPIAVTITGGDSEGGTHQDRRVPKRDLVSTVSVLLESGRLKIAEGLPDAQVLVRELLNFKVKINLATAHDSYEAHREGEHDDLVLAVALAAWYAETRPVFFAELV